MTKKWIKWGRPDKLELVLLLIYGLALYLFNDMINIMSSVPEGWMATGHPIASVEVSLINIAWFSLLIFHIALFTVVSRSIWKRNSTNKYLDVVVGIIMFIGVFLVLIPTVVMLMGQGSEWVIPWFFGLGRITVYHIGLLLQILGMFYFVVTK